MSSTFAISGRCHCGNVSYSFTSPVPKTELPLRICDCSFCTRQGAVYTSHPQGKLDVKISDEASTQWYRYGSETAEVLLCTVCGVFPLITCDIDDRLYAVLNANSINGLSIDRKRVQTVHPVEHSPNEMLQKRQDNWIADVSIIASRTPPGINPSFF